MEPKRLIYFILGAILVSFIVITIPWYLGSREVEYVTVTNRTLLNDLEAYERFTNFDTEKRYFRIEEEIYSVKKGVFPLCYERVKVKTLNNRYTSR